MKTPYQIAADYVAKGWAPIPIPRGEKSPTAKGWQSLRLSSPEQLVEHFGASQLNIGILLGEPSSNLVDVDIDVHEALPFADAFLTPSAIFGRKSKPGSHRLYVCDVETKKFTYKKPGSTDITTLIELRSTGCQTVFPGSVHPSGEAIQWQKGCSAPVSATAEELTNQVAWCAAGALLAREWPQESGARNSMFMALIGGLMNCGWTEEFCKLFIEALCIASNDEEKSDRLKIVKATYDKNKREKKYTGWKTLAEHINKEILMKVREWVDLEVATGAEFELNDLGNAKRFEAIFKDQWLHPRDYGKWLQWTGTHWELDANETVRLRVDDVRAHIAEEMKESSNAKYTKMLKDHRDRLASKGQIENMLELAKDRMAVRSDQLDQDKWALNTKSGIVDLRTGTLKPSDPAALITKLARFEYDPKAEAPRWTRFLNEIFEGKKDVIDFVHKAAGYSLTGVNTEQVMFIMWGSGENGKSTFLEALRHVIEDYSASIASKTLMESKSEASNDVARLKGVRFATTTESKGGAAFDEEKVKLLMSSDTITARFLYQEYFEFKPEFKLWLACNHRPTIRGTDRGIWRRIRLIPFTASFPVERREKGLEDTLRSEAPGILAWLVRGCLRWQQEGLGAPAEVVAATEEYKAEMDVLGSFLSSRCLVGTKHRANPQHLYSDYKQWAQDAGEYTLSQNRLILKLRDRGISQVMGKAGPMLHGVGLRTRNHKGEQV